MPFVLDYDSEGRVVGGHFVEELQNPLLATTDYISQPSPLYEPPNSHCSLPKPFHGIPHRTVSNPLFHPPHLQPLFSQIYQAPSRMSSPIQTKGDAFLAMFIKHFEHDANTMMAFEVLCKDYNKKSIDDTDFYAGIFMLISRTKSWNLLPGLVEVLPDSWQAKDLTWLHEAAEARYEDMASGRSVSSSSSESTASSKCDSGVSDGVRHNSSDALERASMDCLEGTPALPEDTPSPAKRVKRTPSNGFRTSHASATTRSQPLYVNPASLMIHQPVVEAMPTSEEEIDVPRNGRKRLVTLKLKLKTAKPTVQKKAPHRAATAGENFHEKATETANNIEEPLASIRSGTDLKSKSSHILSITAQNDGYTRGELLPAASAQTSQKPYFQATRKGRIRYGDMLAAEIEHFGHFPTRRAVIARASKPYVHLACGKGFSHPMDLKGHHRSRGRIKGGCPGKHGIPQDDNDEWDAHPSARVEYPDLNYTKVKDGYVLLDKASRDKLENAEAAGLRYLAEQRSIAADVVEEPENDTESESAEQSDETETIVEKSSIRATELGLRKRSTGTSRHGI